MFSRDKLARTAEDVANHLLLVDHVKALQQGQKELAAAINAVNDRLTLMEAEFKVLKSEAQRDALREVQNAVNAVQGAFHDKLNALSTKVAIIEHITIAQRPANDGSALAFSDKSKTSTAPA